MSQARAAASADAVPISQSLARAFHDDPMICHLVKTNRPEKFPKLFRTLFKLALPHGGCDVTPGYEAASLWRPPGTWHMHWWDYIANGPALLSIFGLDIPRVLSAMDVVEMNHPKEPHWYLQVIGTDTLHQGKGFAGKIMRHRLAMVDAQNMPAYLESSKDTNIPIYRSFGFEVTGEIKIPDGPTLWPMWRKAQG